MSTNDSIDVAKAAGSLGRDIPWLLERQDQTRPDKTFLVWEPFSNNGEPSEHRQTWTYAEFAAAVDRFAGGLYEQGARIGDRLLLHLDNSPEFVIAWFACARLGAIAVSTNTRSVERDMIYFADHAGITGAITSPNFARLVAKAAPQAQFLVVTDNVAGIPTPAPEGVEHITFDSLLKSGTACPDRPTNHMADLGIQFTSGTTSRPKAVLWTHANAIWGAQVNTAHMKLLESDITLAFLPLFHTNAQSYSMLTTLWVGGTMVIQPKFSASRFWEVSLRNEVTWTSLIPFCIKAILGQPIPDKHHFRFWGTAVQLDDLRAALGIETIGWWGMTETITHGIVTTLDHPEPNMSIGRPAPEYEISIRDGDGSETQPGGRGSLFIRGVRGVSLFKEYYRNPEATAESFDEEGWFATGDLIRIDTVGNLYFSDREKDMLKVGAENIAASEIELVVMETGWVSECAVVGQKHFMLDEVPVVFVILNATAPDDIEDKIIQHCKDQMADFKVVRSVHVVDELPRSTLEKIAKNELRKRLPEITA